VDFFLDFIVQLWYNATMKKWEKKIFKLFSFGEVFEAVEKVRHYINLPLCTFCGMRYPEVHSWKKHWCWNCYIKQHWGKYRSGWRKKFIMEYKHCGKHKLAKHLEDKL